MIPLYLSHIAQTKRNGAEKQIAFHKRFSLVVFLAFVLIFSLAGCINDPSNEEIRKEQEKIDAFYADFLTAFSGTSYDGVAPYLHFEDDMFRKDMAENFKPIFDCKIAGRERLAENFWVYHVYLTSAESNYNIVEAYHFIGEIDGQLQVMIGRYAVPESLRSKTKTDIMQFKPENALDE